MQYTAGSQLPVWPKPGNEPLVEVDRAVVVTVHHQAAVLTAIRPFPQWHVLLLLTDMARLGGIAFIYAMQRFPKTQTLVLKHLHKARESPIIIHQAVADTSLVPLLPGLVLLFWNDHLPLGKLSLFSRLFVGSQLVEACRKVISGLSGLLAPKLP